MYRVLCHVGPGAGLLSRTPFIPMRDKGAIVRHSFLSVGKYHHPSSKALEGGWWGILKEELWFFEGHSQAALWGGDGPALAITTHKSPLGLRELGRHPHLTAHKCAGGSKERANRAWSVVISSTGHWGAAACQAPAHISWDSAGALKTLGPVSHDVYCSRASRAEAPSPSSWPLPSGLQALTNPKVNAAKVTWFLL